MNGISTFDLIEVISPWTAFSGCIFRMKKYGADFITWISMFVFALVSLMNIYALYLSIKHRNNIFVYTVEQAVLLFVFLYITFLLIKKKLKFIFIVSALVFIGIFIYQSKKFDPYHSINPLLSAWFSYSLVICGLIVLTLLAKDENKIMVGYQRFAAWFGSALIIYFVSIFLIYISLDYLQYVNQGMFSTLWNTGICSLLLFYTLLSIAFRCRMEKFF